MAEKKKSRKTDLPKDLRESTHKIWLAGLGALAVAEEEGSKLFSRLVEKGEGFEQRGKKQVEKIKDRVQDVKEEAEVRIGRFGEAFDDKVAKAVHRLGVPSRDEIQRLTKRVEELTAKVAELKPKATKSRARTAKTA